MSSYIPTKKTGTFRNVKLISRQNLEKVRPIFPRKSETCQESVELDALDAYPDGFVLNRVTYCTPSTAPPPFTCPSPTLGIIVMIRKRCYIPLNRKYHYIGHPYAMSNEPIIPLTTVQGMQYITRVGTNPSGQPHPIPQIQSTFSISS